MAMSMTLRIDPKSDKVVFAEASGRVIEFLFDFLRVPIGYVVSLENKKNKDGMVGSLGKLHQGIENLNKNNIATGDPTLIKNRYLYPSVPSEIARHLPSATAYNRSHCPNCSHQIYWNGSRCVQGTVTYMVMDDLDFKPLSTSNIQKLLKELGLDFFALQEKVVQLGDAEGIELFKTALQSKTVLTSVFINKNIDENIKKRKLETAPEVKQEPQEKGGQDAS